MNLYTTKLADLKGNLTFYKEGKLTMNGLIQIADLIIPNVSDEPIYTQFNNLLNINNIKFCQLVVYLKNYIQ